MREKYEQLYEVYLNICKDPKEMNTIEQYKERIKLKDRLEMQLIGMVTLMEACGEISGEEVQEQLDRLSRDFSSIELYGCFLEDGELYGFVKLEGEDGL